MSNVSIIQRCPTQNCSAIAFAVLYSWSLSSDTFQKHRVATAALHHCYW